MSKTLSCSTLMEGFQDSMVDAANALEAQIEQRIQDNFLVQCVHSKQLG